MKWTPSRPDIEARPLESFLEELSLADAVRVAACTNEVPLILIQPRVVDQVNNHLQTQQTELGGLLLGSIFSRSGLTDGISIISILNSIPSDQYEATGASLVMSPSVWQKASLETSNDKFVVGWYHSHPNLGAFFSGTDRTTQDRFFSNPYSIGLVVDPIRNEAAWFRGKDSVEHPDESICVVRDGLALV